MLDPPHYGRGPKGEVWRLEENLAELIATVGELAAERALVILSTYAVGASPLTFERLLSGAGGGLEGGDVVARELALLEGGGERLLPAGFCARWGRGIVLPPDDPAGGA